MAYCRFFDGDVYVYASGEPVDGGSMRPTYVCCGCRLTPGKEWWDDFKVHTIPEMITHLQRHLKFEHKVPQHAFTRLTNDLRAEQGKGRLVEGKRKKARRLQG